jgi:phosphate-selective porin OprO/OprP
MQADKGLLGQYAGFFTRLVAFLLDVVVLVAAALLVAVTADSLLGVFGVDLRNCADLARGTPVRYAACSVATRSLPVLQVSIVPVYYVALWSLSGQTLGKAAQSGAAEFRIVETAKAVRHRRGGGFGCGDVMRVHQSGPVRRRARPIAPRSCAREGRTMRRGGSIAALLALLLPTLPFRVVAADEPPVCPADAARPAGPAPAAGDPGRATGGTKAVGWDRWNSWRSHCLTVNVGTRQMLDVTVFSQDAASVAQLGNIDSRFQWREAKFFVNGELLCFEDPWAYAADLDFGGFNLPQGQRFGLAKLWLEIPLVRWASVKVGRQVTPFSLEILTSGGNLRFMERALAAFDIGSQGGVTVAGATGDERVTWTLGAFSDLVTGGSGVVVASRSTALPLYEDGGSFLLHLELDGRYISPAGGTREFQGRPATGVGPYFVDTGAFVSPTTWEIDAALLLVSGPFWLQAEILDTISLSSQGGDPNLWGWYVSAGWLPTGETRPYDRRKALPGYVVPRSRWGAVELAARYFMVDLDGGNVAGGVMRDLQLGVSWFVGKLFPWSTDEMFRVEVNYGHVWLSRFGTVGKSDVIGFRLQASI